MSRKLVEKLKRSKEYRDAFVASQVSIGIPFQIRALRKGRDWDQRHLAEEAAMLQPRISAMEQPGYGKLTLETLMRLASAFDVALIVRFAPFSELVEWSEEFSPDNFQVQSFGKDPGITDIFQQYRGTESYSNVVPIKSFDSGFAVEEIYNYANNQYFREEIKPTSSKVVNTFSVNTDIQRVKVGG